MAGRTGFLTTNDVIGVLKRHLVLLAACALIGAASASAIAIFLVTPSYVATSKLYVAGAGEGADERLKNGEYARTHVSSYTDMIDSNALRQAVRENMGLPPSDDVNYRDLADNITATNPLETVVIYVTVEDSSPQRAQAVATAIGEVYDNVVAQLENTGGEASPVQINVYSAPSLPTEPASPSKRLYAGAGLLLGLAVGAALAWLLERRPVSSNRRWTSEQVWPDSWDEENDTREVVVRPIRAELGSSGATRATKGERDAATEQSTAAP
jgi:capsular polysaccharide biosynthesis protein